jgi:CheY-like chemotaxis protein
MRERDQANRPANGASRLYLAEDADSVRAQLAAWARDASGGWGVESFPSARALLRRAEYDPPDLALVDLTLPGLDGLTALRVLRRTGIRVALLSPTAPDAARSALEGLLEGAEDCFWKRGTGSSERLIGSRARFAERVSQASASRSGTDCDPSIRRLRVAGAANPASGETPAWLGLMAARTHALGAMLRWLARCPVVPPAGMLICAPVPCRVGPVFAEFAARLVQRPVLEIADGEALRPGPWRTVPEGTLAAPAEGPQGRVWRVARARRPEREGWIGRQADLLRDARFDEVRLILFDDRPQRRRDRLAARAPRSKLRPVPLVPGESPAARVP